MNEGKSLNSHSGSDLEDDSLSSNDTQKGGAIWKQKLAIVGCRVCAALCIVFIASSISSLSSGESPDSENIESIVGKMFLFLALANVSFIGAFSCAIYSLKYQPGNLLAVDDINCCCTNEQIEMKPLSSGPN